MGVGVIVTCLIGAVAVMAAGAFLYKKFHDFELCLILMMAGSVNVVLNIYRIWKGLS